jgi:hypothetical protein
MLAGCGDRGRRPPTGGDDALLGRLAATEATLVDAWAEQQAHRDLAQTIAGRERSGAAALRAAMTGGRVQGDVARPEGDLDALLAAERSAAAAARGALSALRSPAARGAAFDVSVAHAAHEAAILATLGRDPLPDAFGGTLA